MRGLALRKRFQPSAVFKKQPFLAKRSLINACHSHTHMYSVNGRDLNRNPIPTVLNISFSAMSKDKEETNVIEEPALGFAFDDENPSSQESEESLSLRIRRLMDSQPFAVLCTQGEQHPYGSLVAFSMTEDLATAVFATPVTTRKFKLLSQNDRVALLIDNRCRHPDNMMNVEAVTATGQAKRVEEGMDFEFWSRLLTTRHGYLSGFVRAPTVALFRIEIVRYFYVERFQEVRQWIPQRIPG